MERPESRSYYADEASDANALEALLQLAAGPTAAGGLPASPSPADSTAVAHAQSLARSLEARPCTQEAGATNAEDLPAAHRPDAAAGSRDKSAYFVEHDEPRGDYGAHTAPAPTGGSGEAAAQAQQLVGMGPLQTTSFSDETGAVPTAESADGVAHTLVDDKRQGEWAKRRGERGAERQTPQTRDCGSPLPATFDAADLAATGVPAGRGGECAVPSVCETGGAETRGKEPATEVRAVQTSTGVSLSVQGASSADAAVEAAGDALESAHTSYHDIPESIFLPKDLPIVFPSKLADATEGRTSQNVPGEQRRGPGRPRGRPRKVARPECNPDARLTQGDVEMERQIAEEVEREGGAKEDGITSKMGVEARKKKAECYLEALRQRLRKRRVPCDVCAQKGRSGASWVFERCFDEGHLMGAPGLQPLTACKECLGVKHRAGVSSV